MIILREKYYSRIKAKKLKGAINTVLDKKDSLLKKSVNNIKNKRTAIKTVNGVRDAVNNPVGGAIDATSFIVGKPHKAAVIATIPAPLPTTALLAGANAVDKLKPVKAWGNAVDKATKKFKKKTKIDKINLNLV